MLLTGILSKRYNGYIHHVFSVSNVFFGSCKRDIDTRWFVFLCHMYIRV